MKSYFVTSRMFSTVRYILRTGVKFSLVWDKIPGDVVNPDKIPGDVVNPSEFAVTSRSILCLDRSLL